MNNFQYLKKLLSVCLLLSLLFSCKDDDDDVLKATITLESSTYTLSEGATEALSIPVLLSQAWPEDVTINYSLSGSAIEGTDFESISNKSVTIAAGSTQATIDIKPIDNYAVEENDRNIILKLTSPGIDNVTLGNITSTEINLQDNDVEGALVATFEAATYTTNEYLEETVSVKVILNTIAPEDLEISFTLSGTANAGTNYIAPEAQTVMIPAGANSGTINVTIADSKSYGASSTLNLKLEKGENTNLTLGSESSTTIQIINPTVDMSVWIDQSDSFHRLYTYNTFDDVAVPATGRKNSDPAAGIIMDESFAFTYYGYASDNSADPNMFGFRHSSWTEENYTATTNAFNMPDFYKDNDYPNTIDMNTSSKAGLYILEAIRFVPTSSNVTSGVVIVPKQAVRLYKVDETDDGIDNPEYFEVEIEGEGTYSYDETDKSGVIKISVTFDETSIGNGIQVRHFEIPTERRASAG